jgi:SAM-dependent methyltransferase
MTSDPHQLVSPSDWVARFAPATPAEAPALDLAAGKGRHTRLLRSLGRRVVAIDVDTRGLVEFMSDGGVEFVMSDLENSPWPYPGRRFGAIVVTNYLHRPLFPVLLDSLLPGGWLIYETFAVGNEAFGKPSNPDFLLREGELLEAVAGACAVVAFEQGTVETPRPAVMQRIAAIRHPASALRARLPG